MKKYLILACAALLSLGACKKKEKGSTNNPLGVDITQDIPYEEEVSMSQLPITLPFPPGTPINPPMAIGFPYMGFKTDFQSYLDQYSAKKEAVKKAEIIDLRMEITHPANQNFDFFDSIRVYAKTKTHPEILVAYKLPIEKGQRTVVMDIVKQDLKEYFMTDSMFVKLVPVISAIPDSTTKIKLSTKFRLTILGD